MSFLVHSRVISTGVPTSTSSQISSISSFVTAIQRPIVQAMGASDSAKFRAESVNFHVTVGTHTQLCRSLPVRRIWVGEVERAMKLAVGNLAIEGVL